MKMKRKFILLFLIIFSISVFCGCKKELSSHLGEYDEIDKSKKPFTEEFIDGITLFQYDHFDGDITYYEDEETIEHVKEVLREGEYTELHDELAGMYSFEIVSNNERYEFGWSGGNEVYFGKDVYRVINHRFKELLVYTK